MTPFGAVTSIVPTMEKNKTAPVEQEIENESTYPKIQVWPDRQVLHGSTPLSVEIVDHVNAPLIKSVKFYYDDIDVTEEVIQQSEYHFSEDRSRLSINLESIKFKLSEQHRLQVAYQKKGEILKKVEVLPPECSLHEMAKIKNTQSFKPPRRYLASINKKAAQKKYNPNLVAGIVAQESGFRNTAVSWAKALGLMQVTSLAEAEIINKYKKWPRHPEITELSYYSLKTKIKSGHITGKEEWRLNPDLSIEGGIAYINYLEKYWSKKKNRAVLESLPGDKESNLSEVLLASYNSGAARVKKQIQQRGVHWRSASNLKEANKYITKVKSYCYHFAQGGFGHE